MILVILLGVVNDGNLDLRLVSTEMKASTNITADGLNARMISNASEPSVLLNVNCATSATQLSKC